MARSSAVALCCAVALSGCNFPGPVTTDYVEVSGTGEVEAVADQFHVQASAHARGQDIATLKEQVDRQIDQVVAKLKELGLIDEDIRALSFNVHPDWQWQPTRKLLGYQAQRQLELRIEGLDTYSSTLQILADSGLSNINPTGSSVKNTDALADQALRQAVENARHKAEVLAASTGRTLSQALIIRETGGHLPEARPSIMVSTNDRVSDSYYSAGISTVSRQVSVRFELK